MQNRTFTAKQDRPAVPVGFAGALAASRHRTLAAPGFRDRFPVKPPRWLPASVVIDLRDLLGHLWLIPFAIRHRDRDLILVPGFRTNFLLLAMCGLWPLRKKLLFVVNHNLQFALLEGDDGLAELGVANDARQFVVIPWPVPDRSAEALEARQAKPEGPLEMGVVGRDLPEKNTDELMAHLIALQHAGRLPGRVLFASDNDGLMEHWRGQGALTLNTRSHGDYLAALARADVMIMNYERSYYFYRSSAVINDAASLGTPVVCPDYPIFRRQVSEPARIGAVFASAGDILPAIREALELSRDRASDFQLWARSRSDNAFGRCIDDFISRKRAPPGSGGRG